MRQVFHRGWRMLPAGWRRQAYERLTTAMAARRGGSRVGERDSVAPLAPPFLVVGPLSAPTGLGQSARLMLAALQKLELPVSAIDVGPQMMQPATVPFPHLPPARPGPGTLFLAVQPPSVGHALMLIDPALLAGKRRLGFWMWELEALPPVWRLSSPLVDDIAAPSQFAARAIAKGLQRPVRVIPYALPLPPIQHVPRSGPLVFGAGLDLGSTAARKNPLGVVAAFREAFHAKDDVVLSLKVRGGEADPETLRILRDLAGTHHPPIRLIMGDMSQDALTSWWETLDVLVSMHRSEGFGLFPAEAMSRSIPVIATDFSATAEFIDSEVGWPVPWAQVPARDETGRYELPDAVWAEPDIPAAARAMRDAAAGGRERLAERGAAARARIATAFSLQRLKENVLMPAQNRVSP